MSFLLAALVMTSASVDPLLLDIGPKGTARVMVGQIVSTSTGSPCTVEDIAAAADGKRFVYLGEEHANGAHQDRQAEIIRALVKHGRKVVVGLEMYQRPKQDWLDRWSKGELDESAFLDGSDWKKQWGFEFRFYRPVFEAVRENHLPLVALNVPRTWVHDVAVGGFTAMKPEDRAQLPAEMPLTNEKHKLVFDSLTGGHSMSANMYAAQVLWDEAMADSALKWLSAHPTDRSTVFVVIAGSGHVMYKQGINWRVDRRKGGPGITVLMATSDEARDVAKGVGDFVYLARPRSGR